MEAEIMDTHVHNVRLVPMARPREFERDEALRTAKQMFWRKGYEATTAEDLRLAMGIGRQSFYDTFGGKRPLYLEVLRQYNSDGVQACLDRVRGARSPLSAVEELLLSYSREVPRRRALGCMGVSAISEFGTSDPDVARIGSSSAARLEAVLRGLIRE